MRANADYYPTIQRLQNCILYPCNIAHNDATEDKHESWDYDCVSILESGDIIKDYTNTVQAMMDAEASTKGYDSIFTACTYVTSSNQKFAAEGQACVAWRDTVWTACHQIMADVAADTRPAPSLTELLAELPTMVWPE